MCSIKKFVRFFFVCVCHCLVAHDSSNPSPKRLEGHPSTWVQPSCPQPPVASGCNLHASPNHPASRRYIVDLHFKEQFAIAKPTPRYAAISAVLPSFYVGLEENLPPLVSFLVSELSASFHARSCVLPPWRHLSSMLSKWKPRRSLDEPYRSVSSVQSASMSGADAPAKSTTQAPELQHRLAHRQGGKDRFGLLARHTSDPLERHASGGGGGSSVTSRSGSGVSASFRKIPEPLVPSSLVGGAAAAAAASSVAAAQQAGFCVTRGLNQFPTSRMQNPKTTLRPLVTSTSEVAMMSSCADFQVRPVRPATADSARGRRVVMEPQRIYMGDFSSVPAS